MKHYWAIRPTTMPDHIRIQQADTPDDACAQAFGRGCGTAFQWKDLGTRVAVIRSDRKRIALLTDPAGWVTFGHTVK